jgi:site-specific recombinase XerD
MIICLYHCFIVTLQRKIFNSNFSIQNKMNDKVTFSVVFNRQNKLAKNGTGRLDVCACLNYKRKYFPTGLSVKPEIWNDKQKRIKATAQNAAFLNKQITDFVQRLENYAFERRHTEKPVTLDYLCDCMQGKDIKNFTDFVKCELENEKRNAHATLVNKRTTFRVLLEFAKEKYRRTEILFEEVNYNFLKDFENYLIMKGLSINTRNKYFRHIRGWQNAAINKDYFELNKYAFRKFHAPTKATTREYLTPADIVRLENLEFNKQNAHLQKIRDMFLFACYTGLRFSDVSALSKDCIKERADGLHIEMKMQKTNEPINLPVFMIHNGKPIELLKKYESTDPERKHYFDDLTNQYVNRALKEVAALAGIDTKITFHTARHTAATFLLYKGVAVTTVQKILGHKKLQTTQIYSKVMEQTITNELKKVEW